MKSLLPAEAYIGQAWFEREQSILFKGLWQFAAPRMLLAKPNAFVRRRLAGIDVVLQNMDGRIAAFENVCAHRQAAIQSDAHGVRPLVCPYHAWRYGADGRVTSIPAHDECYRFGDDERQALRLRQFRVHEFGQLVFVLLEDRDLAFSHQFDTAALDTLRAASELFDDEVLVTRFEGRFNWKLAYENLRDSLHPQFLHARTLFRQVKFEVRIDEAHLSLARRYRESGSTSRAEHLQWLRSFSGGGLNEPIPDMPGYSWHEHVNRHGTDDWYLNWLLYPNLHIASASGGYAFIIEHHVPVAADRTDLWVYYVTGRKKRQYPTSAAVLMAHLDGARPVLAEDIAIMERVQASLHSGLPPARLGDFEHPNMAIERWYLDALQGRHEP